MPRVGDILIEKLKIKAIYDDFASKVSLSEEQKRIINMLIDKKSIVQISMEIGICERTVNYEIKKIKTLYNNYKQLELIKLIALIN